MLAVPGLLEQTSTSLLETRLFHDPWNRYSSSNRECSNSLGTVLPHGSPHLGASPQKVVFDGVYYRDRWSYAGCSMSLGTGLSRSQDANVPRFLEQLSTPTGTRLIHNFEPNFLSTKHGCRCSMILGSSSHHSRDASVPRLLEHASATITTRQIHDSQTKIILTDTQAYLFQER